ncbi:MAG: ATPase, T2SS/T4P/T4SS family [Elusimicrobiota bacterium]|jgi:type IV pilus assembly protein PilB
MQPQKIRLGQILLQGGVLNQEQLDKAIKHSEQQNCRLGESVVKLQMATEDQIAMAVSKLLGVPFASRENKILSPEKDQGLQQVVEERYARENILVPLFLDENTLAVAMAEPENVLVVENLKLMTNKEIQPFIATKSQIMKVIDDFYGSTGTGLIDRVMSKGDDSPDATGGEEADVTSDARLDLDKMVSQAKGAQIVSLVNAILKQAISERCSDIHIERFDERVMLRFRIHGVLYERTPPAIDGFSAVVSRIKILSKLDIAERRLPQDGAFSLKVQNRVIDIRVSICPTVFGEKVVMRILDKGAVELNIDKIGFEPRQKEDFLRAANSPHGLIFLTGPTGSGKTTTLYTVLNTIKTPEMNFMTIEDPVEFKLEGINQVQVRSGIGLTFAAALRSFLRQDPDVILVGEVRDQETAQTCLRAALTGHLVLSTLHTNSAIEAVVRLTDMGIEPFMLSSSLRMVAAQRLVRTLCPACKQAYSPPKEELERCLNESLLPPPPDPSKLIFYQARGCEKCAKTGYAGRVAIYEVYFVTPKLRDGIYHKAGDMDLLKKIAAEDGMWSLRASGWRKVLNGVTSAEEVLSITVGE